MFYEKKVFFENFAKFKAKHPYRNLFFDKDADLRPTSLLKRRFRHKRFPVNFTKLGFFIEHLWWLLLGLKKLSSNETNILVSGINFPVIQEKLAVYIQKVNLCCFIRIDTMWLSYIELALYFMYLFKSRLRNKDLSIDHSNIFRSE